nr:MAG TPA: hypothetical protein [Caudoviricetes sp.]
MHGLHGQVSDGRTRTGNRRVRFFAPLAGGRESSPYPIVRQYAVIIVHKSS